ncbi:hypothetical protein M8J75_004171 [Diaphorina citri]|nr:hypothetical protein M8J75_004171 [Diaphorina citri]
MFRVPKLPTRKYYFIGKIIPIYCHKHKLVALEVCTSNPLKVNSVDVVETDHGKNAINDLVPVQLHRRGIVGDAVSAVGGAKIEAEASLGGKASLSKRDLNDAQSVSRRGVIGDAVSAVGGAKTDAEASLSGKASLSKRDLKVAQSVCLQ